MTGKIDYPKYYQTVRDVLKEYNLEWEHINSGYRQRYITEARWEIIWRLHTQTEMNPNSIAQIGRAHV